MFSTALISIVLAYGLLLAAACGFQSRLVYFPLVGRNETLTPAALHLPFEEVQIATADGETLHGWFVPTPETRGTVLLFHGNAGNITHRVSWLPMFRQLRLDALLFDYRGYGASTGTPTEAGTYADAEAAWHHLTESRKIPAERIVLLGESLGGAIAAHLAARQTPGALVLHSAFTSVPDLAGEIYPFLPVRLLARFQYDTLAAVSAVRCPVLVVHSRDDDIVPFSHGQRLFDAAPEPKAFIELTGSHNSGFLFMRAAWVRAFDGFLRRHVAASSNPRSMPARASPSGPATASPG
ncbi:MAG: alpha/beta hydrolase [Methylotetracoccus sp.]|jgi:hypothetical protein|nr:alpha/beta hydrolase [Methylotetracoccus sp.]